MPRTDSKMFAAVDLGSNSFRMVVARRVGTELHLVDRMRDQVMLADGLDKNKRLSEAAQRRALACIKRFGQRLATIPAQQARAVGTNTLRQARNARSFLRRAERVLGRPIEVISGMEEARLIYLGVAHTMADDRGRRFVVDIGGGSTECVIGKRFQPIVASSLHMGCVSYTKRFFKSGELKRDRLRQAVRAAHAELDPIIRQYLELGWDQAFGSSGTIDAIERVLTLNRWGGPGVTLDSLRTLRDVIVSYGHVSELEHIGFDPGRAHVLPGGFAILYALMKSLKIRRLNTSKGALREGLLYDLLGRVAHEDVRFGTIAHLCQRYDVDTKQAARVKRTALACLEDVRHGWELEDDALRYRLSWAAQLHEVGLAIAYSGYHKHGAYLLTHSDMPGFSRDEQAYLGSLIALHRRKFRRERLQELHALGGDAAIRIAILLRLAVSINRSRAGEVAPRFRTEARGNRLALHFPRGFMRKSHIIAEDLAIERAALAEIGIRLTYS